MSRFGRLAVQAGLGSAISVVCFLVVVSIVDVELVADLLARALFPLVLVAVTATMVDVLLRALRWRVLVAPLVVVPLGRVMAYMLVGYLANNVLPARAGELVRSHYLGDREGASRVTILGTILVERLLDVIALLLIATAAWWLTGAASQLGGLLAVAVLAGAMAAVLATAIVVLPRQERWLAAVKLRLPTAWSLGSRLRFGIAVVAHPRTLVASAGLTFLAWLFTALVFAAAAGAVGFTVSPAQILLIAAATNLATAIPSAPGYVGTFELAVVATAGALGLPAAPALATAVLVHAAILLTTTVGGLAAMSLLTYRTQFRTAERVIARDGDDALGPRRPPRSQ